MSRAQGINTDFCKVLGLMVSNGLVALSSALLAQYQGFADVNMGRGAIVIGLAAVIIGEAIFQPHFPQLRTPPSVRSIRFHSLLSGTSDCNLDGYRHRPSENAVRTCSCCIPGSTLLEGENISQNQQTWR